VVIRYTYAATTSGDAVLVANATGTDPSGSPVTDKAAVTVDVTEAPATAADYRKLVTSVILDADSVTAQAQNAIANTEASGLATAIGLAGASPGQQAAAIQFGLPPQMGSLIGTVKSSDFSLWVGNYYTTLDADLSGGVTYQRWPRNCSKPRRTLKLDRHFSDDSGMGSRRFPRRPRQRSLHKPRTSATSARPSPPVSRPRVKTTG
jgi:hypothetical protein